MVSFSFDVSALTALISRIAFTLAIHLIRLLDAVPMKSLITGMIGSLRSSLQSLRALSCEGVGIFDYLQAFTVWRQQARCRASFFVTCRPFTVRRHSWLIGLEPFVCLVLSGHFFVWPRECHCVRRRHRHSFKRPA